MKIISLGLGIQSTALYLMSSICEIERADYAIFADPGAEKPETYEHLRFLQKWARENNGIEIIHARTKNLLKDLLNIRTTGRFASIPAYTGNGTGQLRRQCTREYKTEVVDKEIRKIYGVKPRQRFPKTEVWIGFSIDEFQRMKDAPEKWKVKKYPLIDLGMTRQDCANWLRNNGFQVPPKSACVFCPYQNNLRWKEVQESKSFNVVKLVDSQIRNSTKKGIKEPIFLHDSCRPIDDVVFKLNQQTDFFNNICDGDCGV